ncbi:MAG: 16S rRNA (cytidine(1402)-2'-O)-methyltransferase [Chloroflexota bacterium]|nr:16S rRNA (cytidine(1402)-2'-O)-methyltransferase [Chloroflexota bacterium]MDP6758378.1 16S rRNA (cytidine(1402)-2'-O)-methyltransferase [Chloroflexota bacterium]
MGTLYLVATPIGNLADLTERARDVLGAVDVVVAEDTRRTGKLLKHLEIRTKLLSVHGDSPAHRIERVVELLAAGDVAYCTDAGTPGVSDPGAALVDAARAAGHAVSPVPGPSALVAALSVSGIESVGAVFLGFVSRREARRREALESAAATGLPVVIYASPRRAAAVAAECVDVFGEAAPLVVCRELTKLHEEIVEATLGEADELEVLAKARGEYVLVVGPAALIAAEPTDKEIIATIREQLGTGKSLRDAAAAVATELNISRRRAYQLGLQIGE